MVESLLRRRLIAAVPVPFDAASRIDRAAQQRYASQLASQPVGGVAVWAHTGRGLKLDADQSAAVLNDWKTAFGDRGIVIAATGATSSAQDVDQALAEARAMADQAAELGADALLVHPPSFARNRPDRDRLIVRYHAEVARSGLPLVLFHLYEAAGGIDYSAAVLGELLARPEVVGIKVATLDSVMTFQDVSRLILERFPEKLLITGEDRFLGYSLMCGAHAALIGMGAACSALQNNLLQSYWRGDSDEFLRLSALVDQLAQATFVAPMEGYIQRMLWCLVHEGILPLGSAHDPWCSSLPADEFDRLGRTLDRIHDR